MITLQQRPSVPAAASNWRGPWWTNTAWQMPVAFKPSGVANAMATGWTPRTDVIEHEDAYMLWIDLPGFTQEAIDLHFQDRVLTIKGQRCATQEHQGHYHRQERARGAFIRHFTFGKDIEADAIVASFRHGVLEIRLPKSVAAKTKKIAVQAV